MRRQRAMRERGVWFWDFRWFKFGTEVKGFFIFVPGQGASNPFIDMEKIVVLWFSSGCLCPCKCLYSPRGRHMNSIVHISQLKKFLHSSVQKFFTMSLGSHLHVPFQIHIISMKN